MIYTFYSYKGGVGRSMAMANVAELLYQLGLRVLVVDWDLEAPGLEGYSTVDNEQVRDKPGVIDLLLNYKAQIARPARDAAGKPILDLHTPAQYKTPLYPEPAEGDEPTATNAGRLWLLPAGRRLGAHFGDYASAVRTFDWEDFYDNWEGEIYFEWLRQRFKEVADVVLIDSRTGVTEMSGVTTYQLADVVVMFCAGNKQNIEGTREMAANFTRPQVREIRNDRPLEVLIMPARVEDRAETELLNDFREMFLAEFARFLPGQPGPEIEALWKAKIPYVPFYAFKEIVAVREKGASRSDDMVKAFAELVRFMAALAPETSELATAARRLPQALAKGGPLTQAEVDAWQTGTAARPQLTGANVAVVPGKEISQEQRRQLQQALLSALPGEAELAKVVRAGLGQDLAQLAFGTNPAEVVAGIIEWAINNGRVEDLVIAAIRARPDHGYLRVFAMLMGPRVQAEAQAATGAPDAATIRVPFVVAAMTLNEAQSLLDGSVSGDAADLHGFSDLRAALPELDTKDILSYYGAGREEWKPYGEQPIRQIIWETLNRINFERAQTPGTPPIEAQIVSAGFFADDSGTRSRTWLDLAEAGGVVIVDGMSMFHPQLRHALAQLAAENEKVALVVLSPVAAETIQANNLVEQEVARQLKAIHARFAEALDPRCEIGLNDTRELQRWLFDIVPGAASIMLNQLPKLSSRQNFRLLMGGQARGISQAIFGPSPRR